MESLNDLNLSELENTVKEKIGEIANKLKKILNMSPYDWAMQADQNARNEVMDGTFDTDQSNIINDFETCVEIQTIKEKSKLIPSDKTIEVQDLETEASAYENISSMIRAIEKVNDNSEYSEDNIGLLKTCSAKLAVFLYVPEDFKVLPYYNKKANIFKTCTEGFVQKILTALEKLKDNNNGITNHIDEVIGYLNGSISVYNIIKDNINEVKKIKEKYEELDAIDDEKASLFSKLENLSPEPQPNMLNQDTNIKQEK